MGETEQPSEHGLKSQMNRRRFLQLLGTAGAVAAGAAVMSNIPEWVSGDDTDKRKNLVEISSGNDNIAYNLETFGFHPDAVKKMIEREKLDPNIYPILGAAGVSIMHEHDDGSLWGGSGGIVKVKDRYYLATTMHVVVDEHKHVGTLHFRIPGMNNNYKIAPDTLSSFIPRLEEVPDAAVLIPLDDLTNEIVRLESLEELAPLTPKSTIQIGSSGDIEATQDTFGIFRFQGEQVGLDSMRLTEIRTSRDSLTHLEVDQIQGKSVIGPGISGSLVLTQDQDGWGFAGVYDVSVGNEDAYSSDEYGILEKAAQKGAFIPFDGKDITRNLFDVEVAR